MKRRFNHNAGIIKELYGKSFTLESLLNEQDSSAKEKFKIIIQKAKGINIRKKGETRFSITSESDDVEDTAVSFDDAISQLNTELADENISPERKAQIENISGQLAKIATTGEASKEFQKINDASSGEKASGDVKTKNSSKKTSARSGNSAVISIQKIIDPEAKNTKPDGKWGSGTDTAWHEWVANNWEAINELIGDDGKKLTGDANDSKIKAHILAQSAGFNPDISGVSDLCNKISGGESDLGDNSKEDKNEKRAFASFSYDDLMDRKGDFGKKGVINNAVTLYKIPITSLKNAGKGVFGVTASNIRSDQKHSNVFNLISKGMSGIDKAGKFVNQSPDLYLSYSGKQVNIHDADHALYTLIIDGEGFNNAYVREYVVVSDASDDPLFATPVSWLKQQSKFRTSAKNESLLPSFGKSRGQLYRERYRRRY